MASFSCGQHRCIFLLRATQPQPPVVTTSGSSQFSTWCLSSKESPQRPKRVSNPPALQMSTALLYPGCMPSPLPPLPRASAQRGCASWGIPGPQGQRQLSLSPLAPPLLTLNPPKNDPSPTHPRSRCPQHCCTPGARRPPPCASARRGCASWGSPGPRGQSSRRCRGACWAARCCCQWTGRNLGVKWGRG